MFWTAGKMADETSERIENALNKIVTTTEQSGNMRKDLKKIIFETVSTLRNVFVCMESSRDEQKAQISELEREVSDLRTKLQAAATGTSKGRCGPSINHSCETAQNDRCVPPSGGKKGKLFSDVLRKETNQRRYKLTVRSKDNQTPEIIKGLLKSKINPTEIKVGINTFKSLRDGRVLIETPSKEEIEALGADINAKCSGQLEVNIHKLRNPRLVIYDIPEDITKENAEGILITQNPDLKLGNGDINAKFCYKTKKGRNLVIEVGAQTRKILLQTKLKLGWLICKVEDYVVAKRCFRCSRFNHRFSECRGEETCPLCARSHKLKECTAAAEELKCINCMTYNKYNQNAKICVNHSSLDKKCPSLNAILQKYIQNTDY